MRAQFPAATGVTLKKGVYLEYTIYSDESDSKGAHYSNFYGGALVRSTHLMSIQSALEEKKKALRLDGEVKWQKVTAQYLDKYIDLMALFMDQVATDLIKVRIMFTHNYLQPVGLDQYQHEHSYFLLYYQFIKHCFGLRWSDHAQPNVIVRLYLDRLPDSHEKRELFKDHILGLNRYRQFQQAGIALKRDQIAEVNSHDHDVLQCLDVVLGAMNFRLNDKHLLKPAGARQRGKRTIAKEKLYKYLNRRIRGIYPNFNIGITTGHGGDISNRWHHPYRHWRFVPRNVEINEEAGKKNGPAVAMPKGES